jgi:predicted DNA-binding transcriptional regulator AlpA
MRQQSCKSQDDYSIHSEALPPDIAVVKLELLNEQIAELGKDVSYIKELIESISKSCRYQDYEKAQDRSDKSDLLDIKEFAKRLRKSVRWIETALAAGDLPRPIRIGRKRCWHVRTVDAYLHAKAKQR